MSPDGGTFAVGSGWHICLYDVTEMELGLRTRKYLVGHIEGEVLDLTFSPNGKRLASASSDRTAIIWDIGTGKPIARLGPFPYQTRAVRFAPHGELLATASEDGTVIIWDGTDYSVHTRIPRTASRVFSVAFDPGSRILAIGTESHGVLLWDIRDRKWKDQAGPKELGVEVKSLIFSDDGATLAVGCADGTVRLHEHPSATLRATLHHGKESVQFLAYGGNGRLLAGHGRNRVSIWDARKGSVLLELGGGNRVCFRPDGKRVLVWDQRFWSYTWLDVGEGPAGIQLIGVKQTGQQEE
jgi:WD40 repeat protein